MQIYERQFESTCFGVVRMVIEQSGKTQKEWFVAKDVCMALGFKEMSQAVKRHVDGLDTTKRRIENSRGSRVEMTVINESGLYALIFGSKLEAAKSFKHYVTSVMLPSVRRYGAYMTPALLKRIKDDKGALRDLMSALEGEEKRSGALASRIFELESALSAMEPEALFGRAVRAASGSISMGDMAKLLTKNGVVTGRTRLFRHLRDLGLLCVQPGSWNKPTQWTVEAGYFEVAEGFYPSASGKGEVVLWSVTRVTPRGQAYLLNLFGVFRELLD